MKNKEKFAKEIVEIACSGQQISVVQWRNPCLQKLDVLRM